MFKMNYVITALSVLLLMTGPSYAQTTGKLTPVNKEHFTKLVSEGDFCMGDYCDQKEVVTYYRDSNYMTINSTDKINKYGDDNTKKSLNDLKKFLKNQSGADNADITTVFNSCIEYGCIPMGELYNINYPKMDSCRVIYTLDSQAGNMGSFNVRVFANKGDQYVMLSSGTHLATHDDNDNPRPIYKQALKKFGITENYSDNEKFFDYYKQQVQNNKEIQDILKGYAKDLIDFFAIK